MIRISTDFAKHATLANVRFVQRKCREDKTDKLQLIYKPDPELYRLLQSISCGSIRSPDRLLAAGLIDDDRCRCKHAIAQELPLSTYLGSAIRTIIFDNPISTNSTFCCTTEQSVCGNYTQHQASLLSQLRNHAGEWRHP